MDTQLINSTNQEVDDAPLQAETEAACEVYAATTACSGYEDDLSLCPECEATISDTETALMSCIECGFQLLEYRCFACQLELEIEDLDAGCCPECESDEHLQSRE